MKFSRIVLFVIVNKPLFHMPPPPPLPAWFLAIVLLIISTEPPMFAIPPPISQQFPRFKTIELFLMTRLPPNEAIPRVPIAELWAIVAGGISRVLEDYQRCLPPLEFWSPLVSSPQSSDQLIKGMKVDLNVGLIAAVG